VHHRPGRNQGDKEVIDAGTKLRVIARGGVGVDNIDVKHAESSRGSWCWNTPGASAISVAELTIGHMFAVSRFLHLSTAAMKDGQMAEEGILRGDRAVYKKTLGIIGLGNIGKEVRAPGVGPRYDVLAYDPPFAPWISSLRSRQRSVCSRKRTSLPSSAPRQGAGSRHRPAGDRPDEERRHHRNCSAGGSSMRRRFWKG